MRSFPDTCLIMPSKVYWSKKTLLKYLVRISTLYELFVVAISSSLSSLSWTTVVVFLKIIDSSVIQSARLMISIHGSDRHFDVYAYISVDIFDKNPMHQNIDIYTIWRIVLYIWPITIMVKNQLNACVKYI